MVNGTAIHGEDFDDTFEGGPVHAGAVIVPAVLAACERHNLDGRAALLGIAVGVETMCRLSLRWRRRSPTRPAFIRPQCSARWGPRPASARRSGSAARQLVDALGTAASMASGIIEYLAEGAWTKRLHAGWAAQSGLRAALLGRAGFLGPRTVFEGVHGFFHGFAHTTEGDYDALIGDFGDALGDRDAGVQALSVRDHDASLYRLRAAARRARIKADDVVEMVCEVGEGTVHRLWEPLAAKQSPANGYAGKFSTPYCIAAGFVRGNVGLVAIFPMRRSRDPAVLALAGKVRYQIDPKNPYPKNFTGHIRATLRDGTVVEERQPYMRGGAQEPLTRADVEDKFLLNAQHGGWSADRATAAAKAMADLFDMAALFDGPVNLVTLRG